MSIQPTELEKIGQQLLYTFPQVYDSYIPEFAKEAPHFKNLLKLVELFKALLYFKKKLIVHF